MCIKLIFNIECIKYVLTYQNVNFTEKNMSSRFVYELQYYVFEFISLNYIITL